MRLVPTARRGSSAHRKARRLALEVMESRLLLATFTVLNTNDGGADSLRQAILDSNAVVGVANAINFNIPGTGIHTIAPTSLLPTITNPVVIDGTSEPGFAGTPIIELDGTNAGAGNGLVLLGGGSTVRGLVINRFQFSGFGGTGLGILIGRYQQFGDAGGNHIEGNYIGLSADGVTPLGNQYSGLQIENSSHNTIGGTAPGAGNVIAANGGHGIVIENSFDPPIPTGNVIEGNLIGTNAAGTAKLGNSGQGVIINDVADTTVGGLSPAAGNVIAASAGYGIQIGGSHTRGTVIEHNFIGTDRTASLNLGNAYGGVVIGGGGSAGTGTTIGGTAPGAGNIIAFHNDNAVSITSGSGNAILSNSMFSNTGNGISRGQGANPNFSAPPVLTAVAAVPGGGTTVTGTLTGAPGATFRVEFFAGARYSQQGKDFLGSAQVTTDAAGEASFSPTLPGTPLATQAVFANATNSTNDTSVFSVQDVVLPVVVLPVVSTADVSVTETGGPSTTIVGSNLTYTFTVTNLGHGPAQNVSLTNTLPHNTSFVSFTAPAGWTAATPAPGGAGTVTATTPSLAADSAPATFTLVVHVATGSADGSEVIDTTTVATTSTDPTQANNTITTRTAVAAAATTPDLVISLSGPISVSIGQDVTYGVGIGNSGTATAIGLTLTDPLPAGVTFVSATRSSTVVNGVLTFTDLGNLEPGDTLNFDIVLHPTVAGTITNSATAMEAETDPTPDNNTFAVGTKVSGPPLDGTLTGTAPDSVTLGQDVTYTLTATFTGSESDVGGMLTDTLPTNATFVSATGNPTMANGVLTFTFGDSLNAGDASGFTIVVHPTAAGSLLNVAKVDFFAGEDEVAERTLNQTTIVTTAAPASADLAVSSPTATPNTVAAGGLLTYGITITNRGPNPATNVVGTVMVPAHTTFVSITASSPGITFDAPSAGTEGPVRITATAPAANLDQSESFTLVVQVDPSTAGGTVITNAANVASDTADADTSNNSTSASNTVLTATPTPTPAATPTPTPTPTSTPTTRPPPTVSKLQRFGFHAQPTFLVLSFSGPLDPVRAQDPANYTLEGPLSGSGARRGHVIKIDSAVYDPVTNTVTLKPRERLNVHRRDRIIVHGSGTKGMSGSLGALLDGAHTGIPGSDFVATFGREALAGPASARGPNAVSAQAVDVLSSSGGFPVLRSRGRH